MIVELSVENLAIIERANVEFQAGLSALTGETGAGKSLLIDAINLALGERSDAELVRTGQERATVAVVFDLADQPESLAKCEELGVTLEGTRLYVQRDVNAKGGSQCRIGGRMTPVGTLKKLGEVLVDLHGQHDHQRLLDPLSHISYLDDWIGEPAHRAKTGVAEAFARVEEVRRCLNALRAGIRDREQRIDLLRYQVNEIESANPQPGETPELETRLSRLQHAEKLAEASYGALELVSDAEVNASGLLARAVAQLEAASRFDESLMNLVSPLQSALVEVEEAAHELRGYSEMLEADPKLLDEVQARLDTLKRLRRKYGATEEDVLAHLERARSDLASLDDSETSEEELADQLSKAEKHLLAECQTLSDLRKGKATDFAQLVTDQLHDLAMAKARFSVAFAVRPPDAEGSDAVEFHFSANAGEEPRPLAKIASGGEISRLMLAIKTALAGRAGVPTLIFDEVDVGLGGRAAATVARKLRELAEHYQILTISHLPQIASAAETHYRIEKTERAGRVATDVRRLKPDERVEEIARMLAGEEVTSSALANARELLGMPPADLFG